MKKLWLIFGSIIILNGAFFWNSVLCYGINEILKTGPEELNVQKLRPVIRAILKDPRFTYHDSMGWLKTLTGKISRMFQFKPALKIGEFKFYGSIWGKVLISVLKILGIVVLILLPFLIAFFGNRFIQRDWHARGKQNQSPVQDINSDSLKRTALTTAKAGQYREAIRFLYLAGLEKLKEVNLLSQGARFSDKENLKNLRKLLGESHLGYVAFNDLTKVFQEKWYGLRDCGLSDFQWAEKKLELVDSIKGNN